MNRSLYRIREQWKLTPARILRLEEFGRMTARAQGKGRVTRKRQDKPRDLAILLLAGQQGLRVGEIAGLSLGDLERVREGILSVRTLKLRNPTIDECLVDQGVRAALERYLRTLPTDLPGDTPLFRNPGTGRRLTTRALQKVWTRYARVEGVVKSIHAGRHLAATQAVKAGGLKFASKKLRHRNLLSTLAYEDLDLDRERLLLEAARVV